MLSQFFVANFVLHPDPYSLWIGEIVKNGEDNYTQWKRNTQSLSYTFQSEIESVFGGKDFDSMFKITGSSHPEVIKSHLSKELSLETLIILNRILGFKPRVR